MSEPNTTPAADPQAGIVDKIRFLLRKADTSRGTTEAEAQSALAKAQELMLKHGIDKIRVDEAEGRDHKVGFNIVEERHETGRKRGYEDSYVAQILHSCFNVRTLWSTDFTISDHKTKKRRDGTPVKVFRDCVVYYLVGDKDDVAVAHTIVDELCPILRHLFNKYLKKNGLPWSAPSCHSFYEGFAWSYIEINKKLREQALIDSGMGNKYAIVVQDKNAAVHDFIKMNIQTVRARHGGRRDHSTDHHAQTAGSVAGKNTKLGVKKLK